MGGNQFRSVQLPSHAYESVDSLPTIGTHVATVTVRGELRDVSSLGKDLLREENVAKMLLLGVSSYDTFGITSTEYANEYRLSLTVYDRPVHEGYDEAAVIDFLSTEYDKRPVEFVTPAEQAMRYEAFRQRQLSQMRQLQQEYDYTLTSSQSSSVDTRGTPAKPEEHRKSVFRGLLKSKPWT